MLRPLTLTVLTLVPVALARGAHCDQRSSTPLCRVVHAFRNSSVVPQVIPRFEPSALLETTFPPHFRVRTGQIVTNKILVAQRPAFKLKTADAILSKLLVVAVDPDAPDPSNPYLSDVLHGLTIDAKVNRKGKLNGTIVADWLAPGPLTGLHRCVPAAQALTSSYVTLVYTQPKRFKLPARYSLYPDITSRLNFSLADFVKECKLKGPIAGTFFNLSASAVA